MEYWAVSMYFTFEYENRTGFKSIDVLRNTVDEMFFNAGIIDTDITNSTKPSDSAAVSATARETRKKSCKPVAAIIPANTEAAPSSKAIETSSLITAD